MRHLSLACAFTASVLASVSAQAATYNIDPTHTFVTFEVTHFGTSTNRGRFDKKKARCNLTARAKLAK